MHPFLLIPLVTLIGSCLVGSASVARDVGFRPNRAVAWIMGCTGAWALVEIIYSLQTDRDVALAWVRALGFVYLPLGPLVLELLARLGRLDAFVWGRLCGPLWAVVATLAVGHVATPWFVADVAPAPSGWHYRFGPAFWPCLALTLAGCLVAALRMIGPGTGTATRYDARLRTLGVLALFAIAVTFATDVLLPALERDGPRLGAASIVLACGVVWLGSLSAGNPDPASGTLARRFLDQLPDGVAILRCDGTLRAANERLATILGREADALIGRPVDEWLEERGVGRSGRLRERQVATPAGPVPVAIWESDIRDRQGTPIGRVLVLRDQRALVELRRRLVTAGQKAALGELAAGIAHEVNNPIAWVLSNLNQLRQECEAFARAPEGSPAVDLADAAPQIDTCVDRLGRVVDFVAEVRSFAHPGCGGPVLCQANELVQGALRLAAPRLREEHTLVFDLAPLPEVRAVPQELKHALLSVLLTLGQEMTAPGRIAIVTSRQGDRVRIDFESDADLGRGALLDGAAVLLATGSGARSTGLLIPGHIVRQQGGTITTEPLPGGGWRVRIALPAHEAPDALPVLAAAEARA